MEQQAELDMGFLERSLEQSDAARRRFFRNAKIAILLALAFQFLIFFRYVDLEDEKAGLDQQLTLLRQDQAAIGEVQDRLAELQEVLLTGEKQLRGELENMPVELRQNILGFGAYVVDLREEAGKFLSAAPVESEVSIMQRPLDQELRPLYPLSDKEREILASADPGSEEFQQVADQIIEVQIIQPTLRELERARERWLIIPFSEKSAALMEAVGRNTEVLARYEVEGATPVGLGLTEDQIILLGDRLAEISFQSPQIERWWSTFAGKEEYFDAQSAGVDEVIQQIDRAIRAPVEKLRTLRGQVDKLLGEEEQRQKEIQSEIEEVQERYIGVQELLQTYAKPLSWVAVDLREAVLYFPLAIAVCFCYLVVRYVALNRQVRDIMTAYEHAGVSSRVLDLYFADYPSLPWLWKQGIWGERGWDLVIAVAVLLLPAGLLGSALCRLLSSEALAVSAPLPIYMVSVVLLLFAYAYFAAHARWMIRATHQC